MMKEIKAFMKGKGWNVAKVAEGQYAVVNKQGRYIYFASWNFFASEKQALQAVKAEYMN